MDTILDLFPSQSAGKFGRRQKRERGSRLPVTIVTGFLGAGKTTLVRRFLDSPEGKGTALIVNEFGSEGIDEAPEARKQAILADRIVISKSDIADGKTVKKLTAMLEDLNPRAAIDVAVKGDIDPKTLTDTGQTDAIERHSGFVAEASHSDGILSFVMRDETP